jgi:hypothetical protein
LRVKERERERAFVSRTIPFLDAARIFSNTQ